MKKFLKNKYVVILSLIVLIAIAGISLPRMLKGEKTKPSSDHHQNEIDLSEYPTLESLEREDRDDIISRYADMMPVYGNWRTFTTKDGLPDDKCYSVRIDGDRVLVGTHHGLAVYENGLWRTYTTEDGLAHNGVASIDVSPLTGDVWIGTLGGLNRWSGGKFETFNQFNSGMPNDLVYNVFCYGKDIWVATGGGAGLYDTQKKEWKIFTEMNAPMHEPWTYALSAGDGRYGLQHGEVGSSSTTCRLSISGTMSIPTDSWRSIFSPMMASFTI